MSFRLPGPALMILAAAIVAPGTSAYAALVTAPAYQPTRIDKPVRRNGQGSRPNAPESSRISPTGNAQADRAWTEIMVRPCVRSGNRLVC